MYWFAPFSFSQDKSRILHLQQLQCRGPSPDPAASRPPPRSPPPALSCSGWPESSRAVNGSSRHFTIPGEGLRCLTVDALDEEEGRGRGLFRTLWNSEKSCWQLYWGGVSGSPHQPALAVYVSKSVFTFRGKYGSVQIRNWLCSGCVPRVPVANTGGGCVGRNVWRSRPTWSSRDILWWYYKHISSPLCICSDTGRRFSGILFYLHCDIKTF